MCLVFISLKTALSYSPRVSRLLLFHHFSYCGSLLAVPKTANAGQMDRAKDSTTLRNGARRNSNTRPAAAVRTNHFREHRHVQNCVFSMCLERMLRRSHERELYIFTHYKLFQKKAHKCILFSLFLGSLHAMLYLSCTERKKNSSVIIISL